MRSNTLADVYPTPTPAPSGNTEPEGDRLIAGVQTYESITDRIGSIVLYQTRQPIPWYVMAGIGFLLLNLMMYCVTYLLFKGVGIWGINEPSAWGFDIINFVWWIGIGHAGTLISAILLLLTAAVAYQYQPVCRGHDSVRGVVRRSVPPAAHGASLGGLLDVPVSEHPVHVAAIPQSADLGRVRGVHVCDRVSAVFWFIGLIPDLASLRDRATNIYAKLLFGAGALGWRGSASHWERYETAYLILAGLSTPLVLSVHSIVSFDFCRRHRSGLAHHDLSRPTLWREPCSPGFAMVITFGYSAAQAVPSRRLHYDEALWTGWRKSCSRRA